MDYKNLNLEELVKIQAEVNAAIAEKRQAARDTIVKETTDRLRLIGFNADEIQATFGRIVKSSTSKTVRADLPVAFKDEHGNTWSGRGRKPSWLLAYVDKGGNIDDLKVKP